jgi:hypothetical protein
MSRRVFDMGKNIDPPWAVASGPSTSSVIERIKEMSMAPTATKPARFEYSDDDGRTWRSDLNVVEMTKKQNSIDISDFGGGHEFIPTDVEYHIVIDSSFDAGRYKLRIEGVEVMIVEWTIGMGYGGGESTSILARAMSSSMTSTSRDASPTIDASAHGLLPKVSLADFNTRARRQRRRHTL